MKEAIYDEKIAPLMTQILAICQEAKIPMIADFGLGDDLHCTSALLDEAWEPSPGQVRAFEALRPKPGIIFAITSVREEK